MVLRRCLITGIVFLWTSVLVIPLGTHLQTQSPQFPEYERQFYADIHASHPDKDLGIGLVLAFAWPIVGCYCVFIGLLFTVGIKVVRGLLGWRREAGLLVAGVFSLGCLAGSLLGLREAFDNFRWGFAILGMGYLFSAAGLGLGGLGVGGSCLQRQGRCRQAEVSA